MKRPWYLTAWLILGYFGSIVGILGYTLGFNGIQMALHNVPSWHIMLLLALSVADLIAITMLWKWKRTGFYIKVLTATIASIVNFSDVGKNTIIISVLSVTILWLVMRPVWNKFK